MSVRLCILSCLVMALAACGGSASPAVTSPAAATGPALPEASSSPGKTAVYASAARDKNLLRVDVAGVSHSVAPEEDTENAALWVVEALHGRQPLRRLVISPSDVRRESLPNSASWDVTVQFAVYFEAPPEPLQIALRIIPPGGTEHAFDEEIGPSELPPPDVKITPVPQVETMTPAPTRTSKAKAKAKAKARAKAKAKAAERKKQKQRQRDKQRNQRRKRP